MIIIHIMDTYPWLVSSANLLLMGRFSESLAVLTDTGSLRSFRAEYGRKARSGLLVHAGTSVEWITPDVLAVPWWKIL